MSGFPLYVIDAFADQAFQGNPAAVCLMTGRQRPSAEWMQNVAAEMNLSETAFVDVETRSLRWFTPAAEVDLCGHATVATARAMLDAGYLQRNDQAVFQTRSGELTAKLLDADPPDDPLIQLDFPATPPAPIEPASAVKDLFPSAKWFGASRFDLLVELSSQEEIEKYCPDFTSLKALDYRGVIITAPSTESQVDFVSRFFAPAVGVNEDPVTGSAHCCLAPYWSEKQNKNQLTAKQLSERGGRIELQVMPQRVKLTGGAVMVLKGVLIPNAHS